MSRMLLSAVPFLLLGLPMQAEEPQRPLADLIAQLNRTDGNKLKALQEMEALGEKAAEAAPAVVELLNLTNEDIRLQATITAGKMGKAAVAPLTKALDSKNPDVRFYAVWGLGFVGTPAKGSTAAVVKALTDGNAGVRRKAAFALARLEADPETVAGFLVESLGDENADVRQAAMDAIPAMGKSAVPHLLKALTQGKPAQQTQAILTLGKLGSAAEPAIPSLKKILLESKDARAAAASKALAGIGVPALATLTAIASTDEDPHTRSLAIEALHDIGVPAVPAMVDLLSGKHADMKQRAATFLGSMQVQDKMVVIGLGFATKDNDYQVRRNALNSLRAMGAGAKLAEPYVSALLVDLDPVLRVEAFHTLQGLGVDPKPGLKKALSHPDVAVRITTASLMSSLNIEVLLAEPILLEGLKEKNEALKMQAATSLSRLSLQPEVVLPIFIAGLKNETASVRRQAAEAIAHYGSMARKASPDLIACLDDSDNSVRAQSLQALRRIGGDPKGLVPSMVKILKKANDPLHAAAASVLFLLGPDAVHDLTDLLEKENAPALRLTCLQALAMVGPAAKPAVPALIQALRDDPPRARLTAARALGNIGPDAYDAVDPLAKLEKDADANVGKVAKAALLQIRDSRNDKEIQAHGVLTSGDPLDPVRQGCFHVVHTYTLKGNQKYVIDLISIFPNNWDNFLRIETSQGKQLAQDDDGGGNLNARLNFTPPQDGLYRIIVTSCSANQAGSYLLKIR